MCDQPPTINANHMKHYLECFSAVIALMQTVGLFIYAFEQSRCAWLKRHLYIVLSLCLGKQKGRHDIGAVLITTQF